MNYSTELQITAEILLSMVFGAAIGYDRETAKKPAGLRTHILVAGAAALLVGVSEILRASPDDLGQVSRVADPVRVIEAIITGVSFIGAGTILRQGRSDRVEGLTTAASLLMSAAAGISVALHQLVLAAAVTIITLCVLRGLNPLEKWIHRKGAS